jgi:FAR1 DNA-binding domain-containing protein
VDAAVLVGFVLTKSNMNYSTEKVALEESFTCYKSGKSKIQSTSKRGTAKTDCPFKLNFRFGATEMTYHFTESSELAHNHPLNPSTVTMTALKEVTETTIKGMAHGEQESRRRKVYYIRCLLPGLARSGITGWLQHPSHSLGHRCEGGRGRDASMVSC